MTDYNEAQFARLPKWARDHITRQERSITSLAKRVADIEESPNTAVWLDPYGHHGTRARAVADRGEYVRFTIGDHDWVDVRVERDGVCVDVMGSSSIAIACRASNTLGLTVVRR